MPNPFPGMNPYLEDVSRWKGLHNSLIDRIADALDLVLPPGYSVETESRVVLAPLERSYYPDVVVQQDQSSNIAVETRSEVDSPVIMFVEDEEELYLSLRHADAPSEVVTVIEVLSPTNKGVHRSEYLDKQREWHRSESNLLEIDLLRAGTPVLVPLRERETPLQPRPHYAVCLHRAGAGNQFEVWPRGVQEPLPRVAVPLRPREGQVVLDIGPLINDFYERRRLHQRIDYRREPLPPFEGEDALWLDSHLRGLGLR